MKITQVLKEAAQISAAFAFGRFNPAHQGHIAVWRTVQDAAAKWYIGTNPSTLGPNDPLTFEQKSAWMSEIYQPTTGHIAAEQSVMTLAAKIFTDLGKNETVSIAYITDADDWSWSGKLLNQYNGVSGAHGYYKFAEIVHVPSPRVSSATALRDAARADDKVAFYQASGTDPKLKVAGLTYFDTVKQAVTKYPLPVKKAKKVAEGSLNEFAITPDDGSDGKQAGRWLITYMTKDGTTKEKIMVGKNADAVSKYFEFKYRRKPLSVVPYVDDMDLRGKLDNLSLDEQVVAEGSEYKSRHAHKQEQDKAYNDYRTKHATSSLALMTRAEFAKDQRERSAKKKQGVAEGVMNTIANKVMGAAPEQPKYKVGQRVKYETSPRQPDWKDGGRGVGVITAYKNGHYMINGNPVNHFEIKGVVEQGVAEGMAGLDDAEPYTIGGAVDKQYVYIVRRDGKSMGIYHSLDDAKSIVANNKQTNKHSEFKIMRKSRSKMAGPVGQLPEQGVAEVSLATMRDYFAGDENAKDATKLSQMRDFFSKHKPEGKIRDKHFNSNSSYEAWLRQQKMKKIGEDDEAGEVEKTGNLIPFPKGTTKIDVEGEYDWYKLGQVISDLDDADPAQFGTGPASAMIAFGSEAEEHKYLPLLKRLGMQVHDIDQPTEGVEIIPVAEFVTNHLNKTESKFTSYELAVMEGGHSLPESEKIAGRYDPADFDSMVQRLGKIAKAGPVKTVWDPVKQVYKTVPDTDKQKKIAEAVIKVVEVIKQRKGLWRNK